MKNFQKGFVVPLLLTIIALLIIDGGVYFYRQRNQSSTIELNETATTTETTNQTTTQEKQSTLVFSATPTSGVAPLTVTFSGTISTANPSSDDGLGLGVDEPYIDFGDAQEGDAPSTGEVSCSSTPHDVTNYVYPTSCTFSPISHTYQLPGTYTVVLHLGVQKGTDIILGTTTIVVTGNGPVFQKSLISPSGLTASPSSGARDQPITFSTSYGGLNSGAYFVDFGDNSLEWFLCGQTLPGEQANESCLPPTFQYTYGGTGAATYIVTLHKYTGSFNDSPTVGTANVTLK
jgi:PKD repeat protein